MAVVGLMFVAVVVGLAFVAIALGGGCDVLCAKLATRKDGIQFPCGQCSNCRINRRRAWQARLLLEAASHEYSVFVTLTFRDVGTPHFVRRSDIKWFIRQIREKVDVRYFCAAEYGGRKGRAHYHLHIFSARPLSSVFLGECWPFGDIDVGDTEPASLDYTLGYLLKDPKVRRWPIEERFPEFRSSSPGIGKFALPHLLIDGCLLPREFRVYGRTWPVARYLRDRAKAMGFEVSERECVRLERLEAQALRSLLLHPDASEEEIEQAYAKFWADKKSKSQLLQKKAIRAAYLAKHGHVKKGNQRETF